VGTTATVLNWTIWTAFVIEIGLMLSVVDDRWRWLRDHPLDVAIGSADAAVPAGRPASHSRLPAAAAGALWPTEPWSLVPECRPN
jgi:hypothetical protein